MTNETSAHTSEEPENSSAHSEAISGPAGTADQTILSSREMGPQPLTEVLTQLGLLNHDLVAASVEQLTHKMVARAVHGRWCTPNCRRKIARALSTAAGRAFSAKQLFNY
jgi:hypothetical protein